MTEPENRREDTSTKKSATGLDDIEETRGEQGTSSGDPHDDTDPQSGS